MVDRKELDRVYSLYKKATNMGYKELLKWSMTDCSRKASLDRRPLKRNLNLLSKNKSEWTNKDIKEANKVISYLARAKEIKSNNIVCNGYTRNELALKNWSFDVRKR